MNQEVTKYILEQRSAGATDVSIRQILLAKGWNPADIDMAFSAVSAPAPHEQLKASQGPVPPPPGHYDPSSITSYQSRVGVKQHLKPQINSPYSVLLAILLTMLLLTLAGQISKDVMDLGHSQDAELLLESVVTFFFLAIGLFFHKNFELESRKFLILAQPYYLVAGYMLIRLLYHASIYILDKNVTYGIYIVLILIIAVLSGSILFLQKYIKHHDQ